MTQKTDAVPKLNAQDKAERTTLAAATIMSEERKASDAKVARLKAMRLASEPASPVAAPASKAPAPKTPAPRTAKRASASTIRKLSLQPDASPRKRKTV